MPTTSPTRRAKPRKRPPEGGSPGVIVKLIRIGNSRGVRIPKAMIEQAGLTEDVEMTVRPGEVILQSRRVRRAGWAESIRAAIAAHGHDVDEDFLNLPNEFDEKEWTWPSSNSTSTSSRSTRRRARK
jgi:antitoxin MazE